MPNGKIRRDNNIRKAGSALEYSELVGGIVLDGDVVVS
jgi:hypothetical protein